MTASEDLGARPVAVQALIDVLLRGFAAATEASAADSAFVAAARARLDRPALWTAPAAAPDLPGMAALTSACSELDEASPSLRPIGDAILKARPFLSWVRRASDGPDAAALAAGHANALVTGPTAPEQRSDIIFGLSIMAPGIAYPFHNHPPDELYLVLSDGAWWRDGAGWFSPGIGGTVRNPPGIRHAMRAGARPLLAAWLLQP